MVIGEISKQELIQLMRQTLDLPSSNENALDDTLIAASIRRAAGFLCPCSRVSLINALTSSLTAIADDREKLFEQLENGIDKLFVVGDLLELSEVSIADDEAKGTWVFAAPPGFVSRANGNILLFGLTPDESSAVPSLSQRIVYDGYKRIIKRQENEPLESTLQDLGLIQVSEKAWLQIPKLIGPDKLLHSFTQKFQSNAVVGEMPDFEIIDHRLPFNFYRKRWVTATDQTGIYVGRRPQVYGSPVWVLFDLSHGSVVNFIDLPLSVNGIRQRGCDSGWHCQLAIDSLQGNPQTFGLRVVEHGAVFDFYSPIPLWADRRLSAIGNAVQASRSLFSYFVPEDEVEEEERFLREYLWMKPLQ